MTLPTNYGLVPSGDRFAHERKLAAKKFDEHVKLVSSSLNAVALATFGAGILLPGISGNAVSRPIIWFLIAAGLHLVAHAAIRLLRSED